MSTNTSIMSKSVFTTEPVLLWTSKSETIVTHISTNFRKNRLTIACNYGYIEVSVLITFFAKAYDTRLNAQINEILVLDDKLILRGPSKDYVFLLVKSMSQYPKLISIEVDDNSQILCSKCRPSGVSECFCDEVYDDNDSDDSFFY